MRPRPEIGSWFAGAVIYMFGDDGITRYIIQKSKTTNPKYPGQKEQRKFPGGKNEPGTTGHVADRDILATLKREIKEELYLRFKADADEPMLIHHDSRPDDLEPDKWHEQGFFLLPYESLEGEMRTEKIFDGSTKLWPPYWVTLEELSKPGFLYRSHRPLLKVLKQMNLRG